MEEEIPPKTQELASYLQTVTWHSKSKGVLYSKEYYDKKIAFWGTVAMANLNLTLNSTLILISLYQWKHRKTSYDMAYI